jgi:exonuclease SbcD
VFERCLVAHVVPEDQQAMLRQTYREVIVSLDEEDERAE